MLSIIQSSCFKSEVKKFRGERILNELENVLNYLVRQEPLPAKYRPHPLLGKYKNYLECHIKPDILLIYSTDEVSLYLYRIGSHSDLF